MENVRRHAYLTEEHRFFVVDNKNFEQYHIINRETNKRIGDLELIEKTINFSEDYSSKSPQPNWHEYPFNMGVENGRFPNELTRYKCLSIIDKYLSVLNERS